MLSPSPSPYIEPLYCPCCKHSVAADAVYCPHCGRSQIAASEAEAPSPASFSRPLPTAFAPVDARTDAQLAAIGAISNDAAGLGLLSGCLAAVTSCVIGASLGLHIADQSYSPSQANGWFPIDRGFNNLVGMVMGGFIGLIATPVFVTVLGLIGLAGNSVVDPDGRSRHYARFRALGQGLFGEISFEPDTHPVWRAALAAVFGPLFLGILLAVIATPLLNDETRWAQVFFLRFGAGAGALYNRQYLKAMGIGGACAFLWLGFDTIAKHADSTFLSFSGFSGYLLGAALLITDAVRVAQRLNRGEVISPWAWM